MKTIVHPQHPKRHLMPERTRLSTAKKKRKSSLETPGSWVASKKGETESASNSKWPTPSSLQNPSLEFPPLPQEKLKEIYSQKRYRKKSEAYDSEESEDDDVLSLEDLRKTEAYQLILEDIAAMNNN